MKRGLLAKEGPWELRKTNGTRQWVIVRQAGRTQGKADEAREGGRGGDEWRQTQGMNCGWLRAKFPGQAVEPNEGRNEQRQGKEGNRQKAEGANGGRAQAGRGASREPRHMGKQAKEASLSPRAR